MGTRIFSAALVGWAAIVWLSWWMANARIELCNYEADCILKQTATRDYVLSVGLTGGLFIAVLILFSMARPASRLNQWNAASRARPVTEID